MSGVLERTLAVLECLAAHPEGMSLGTLTERLNIPASAGHRLLTELSNRGYVRQLRDQGDYVLTTKLVAMVLDYMGAAGIVDFAQPVLDRLAQQTSEFIRLGVIDGDRLAWIARAQGARKGLRYDPDIDASAARLSCTASGHAWLATMSDEDALALVSRQGFGQPKDYGPNAPVTARALLDLLDATRKRGYAVTRDMFDSGLASMATTVLRGKTPVGVLSIAGPSVRMSEKRMIELAPLLKEAAREVGLASATSPLFASRRISSERREAAE